jgi:small subunit ribosomal protein S13
MARIAGVTLPREKRVEIGLTYVYGIGRSMSNRILSAVKIDPNTHVKDLTEDEEIRLRGYIEENVTVEGDLRRERSQNYRGIRHRRGMPVRGQRTKTNARVRKGHKPTVGVKKKVRV